MLQIPWPMLPFHKSIQYDRKANGDIMLVLFQTKDGATQAQVDNFMKTAEAMAGQIPGLLSVETGKAIGEVCGQKS